jgi:predicted amidohydrolase
MTFTVGLVQMRSGRDMARNIADAADLIREAKAAGADFVLTPENTNIMETDKARQRQIIKPEREDVGVATFASLARDLRLWLMVGSLSLMGEAGKPVNRSLLFTPAGEIAGRYDKIHLFDVTLPDGQEMRESESVSPGNRAVVADLPWCRLGMTICYDVRFAVLHRALAQAGATVLTVPSAFTVPTGQAHWHVLLRARAIETGSFVLAAAQGGIHDSGRATFGHSLAVSPWGEIIAEAGTEPGVTLVNVDPAQSAVARSRIPALRHDRPFTAPELKPVGSIANSVS